MSYHRQWKKRVKIVCTLSSHEGKDCLIIINDEKIKLACKLSQPYISFKMLCSNIAEDTSLVKGRIFLLSTLGKRTLMICICNNTAKSAKFTALSVYSCSNRESWLVYSGNFVFILEKDTHTKHIKVQLPKLLDRIIVCNKSYGNYIKALML